MKKLWKKGLPALVLLVFGVMSTGCDNGTTSSAGDSVAVVAQKFANELDRLFEGSGSAISGSEEGVVLVEGSPVLNVRLDSKNPNVTKNIEIPAGVTLRLGEEEATDATKSLTLSSRSTLAENVGKATFVIKGKGTLELMGLGALIVDSGAADQTSATTTVTSYLVIENGVTIKFSAVTAEQSVAIANGNATFGSVALPGDQITWKTGAKVFAGAPLATADLNGLPTQDENIILDFIVQGKDGTTGLATLDLAAGDKIGSLTINKNGAISVTALLAGEKIVVSKVTVNGKKAGAVDIGGAFAPESGAGNFIVAGDIVVNDDGEFTPADQIVMGKVYLNGKAIATIGDINFDFSELYIAKDAKLSVGSTVTNLAKTSVGVKLDNKGKINLESDTMLELTVDPRNKQTHINEGTIEILADTSASTLALTGGITLENKGTIKFVFVDFKSILEINDNSKVINSKIIDMGGAAGSISFVPVGDSYPSLSFTSGSELQNIYLAKTSGSAGTNITEATLRTYNAAAPVTPPNLETDNFYLAFDAYTGYSPYGTAVNVNRLDAEATTGIPTTGSGYLKFKSAWNFNPEGLSIIGDVLGNEDEANVTGITLTFEESL